MARIAGIDLPDNKRIVISLTYIYGIGDARAADILRAADVDPNKRTHQLSPEEVARLRSVIDEKFRVEGELRREVSSNIKRLMDIGTYRGLRHRLGLPVRGQRTRSNSRTRKGKAVAIAGKKKATKK